VVLSRVSTSALPGKQTIFFYALWCLSAVVSSFFLRGGAALAPVQIGMEIFDAAFTLVWVLALRRDILRLYVSSKAGFKPYLVALVAAYPVALIIHSFVTVLERKFSLPVVSVARTFLDGGFGWGVVFVSVCVQPAVIEELAFRGVILTTLADVMKPVETIVVAAIAFSIMHFSVVMFAPFVLMGLYLGWLRQWSGSLWPAMLAHFLHNSLVTLHEARAIFPL
jgi:membrane protease YdiL (CAAX protease family)